jgi:predicted nucleic acid-binding Zn ribbon protein
MPIGAIVGRSITELGWVGPLAEARLLGHWASVVGPEIAGRCQPVSLLDGELKISAESTAWATQLRLMAPQLLARICREMPPGTVRRLVISGPSGPSWKRGPWSMRGGRGVRDTYG